MKIAIVGYGKMGRMIERVAAARGHEIAARFDIDNNVNGAGLTAESLAGVDAAIEFSTPDTVLENIRRLAALRVPTVVGTTGWHAKLAEVKRLVESNEAALVYGANFSIGVNLFYKLVRDAAALLAQHTEYDPFLIEAHHKFKKDAPSGTALVIADQIRESYGGRTPEAVSIRAGHIPGTHEVGFDSEADMITLTHTARSREGFAAGAVLAAEKIVGRRGVFEFPELLFESNHRPNESEDQGNAGETRNKRK
ncbi:MAG: 4-hydroxy-tetrahydrodipicolinate reductase [Blastocatellia bacterium]